MEKIWDLIKNTGTCVLATSLNDKPRASIMEHTVIDNKIVFSTVSGSIKAKNLEKNNQVSISVMKNFEYVTLDGILETSTEEETEKYLKILKEKHPELIELEKSGKLGKFVYYTLKNITAYYGDMSGEFKEPLIVKL
ncbi:pyridoxamine 5'-phosphate oxidase family protein [Sebaldella sp. S0638]|uniref:pyridoxamine 5'-phosphate oxidase family protein n=1 Tax=Sebaldella sp. S0638 TaxID=2957809 RepID=UPI00209E51F6|nr:pyridoxamine 5'-phosphate oxidase family protein [Sebaldella sp. S0638]MCP1223335.1 pyridoxamine 5'-phosphate oxidase family protein [Sebaldella sp. S0638]